MENNILQLMKKIQLLSVEKTDTPKVRFAIINFNGAVFNGSFVLLYFAIIELFYNNWQPNYPFFVFLFSALYIYVNIPLRLKLMDNFVIFSFLLIVSLVAVDVYFRPHYFTFTYYLAILTFIPIAFVDKFNKQKILISFFIITFLIFGALFLSDENMKTGIDKNYYILNLIGATLLIINNLYFTKAIYEEYFKSLQKNVFDFDDEAAEEKEQLLEKQNKNIIKITELALQDDPAFMPVFKEHYHKFYTNLTKKHPDLNLTERKFCALLYLEFSSKEIAEILKISHRTAQTRKHNLRQKTGIHTSEDLYFSIKKLEFY